ncbi:MAG: HAMP domain-containing protein, partial [Solobacterium sp.]|nr:HAMP domain-containing protein [Solobacterium sp.]
MMNLIGEDTRNSVERYTASIEHSIEMISNIAADSLDRVVLAENGVIGTDAGQTVRTAEQQEQLDAYLQEYCDGIRETFTGIAAHTHGITSYYFCISPDISRNVQGFFYYRAGKTGFDRHEGLDVSALDPADGDQNAWFFTPIQHGRPSWVGPYSASVLKDMWVVSYSVPLYCSGSLIGVIGMDIPVDILIDQVRDIRVYRTGYVSLLDAENRVLYHPDWEFRSMLDAKELPFSEKVFLREDSGDELIRFSKNGKEQQMSFCTLSNGMKLVIVAPTKEINAAWISFAQNSLVITVLITILFAVIVMLAMRAITRPLRNLTAASQRLADADYDVELSYRGKDEVGTLTAAFMKMRDQIKQYIEILNRQLLTDRLTGLP